MKRWLAIVAPAALPVETRPSPSSGVHRCLPLHPGKRSDVVDLNYLFHRQQVEHSRAEAAASEAAREIHEELAREYEQRIEQLSEGNVSFAHATASQVKNSPSS
jgi:hypothetical protein